MPPGCCSNRLGTQAEDEEETLLQDSCSSVSTFLLGPEAEAWWDWCTFSHPACVCTDASHKQGGNLKWSIDLFYKYVFPGDLSEVRRRTSCSSRWSVAAAEPPSSSHPVLFFWTTSAMLTLIKNTDVDHIDFVAEDKCEHAFVKAVFYCRSAGCETISYRCLDIVMYDSIIGVISHF